MRWRAKCAGISKKVCEIFFKMLQNIHLKKYFSISKSDFQAKTNFNSYGHRLPALIIRNGEFSPNEKAKVIRLLEDGDNYVSGRVLISNNDKIVLGYINTYKYSQDYAPWAHGINGLGKTFLNYNEHELESGGLWIGSPDDLDIDEHIVIGYFQNSSTNVTDRQVNGIKDISTSMNRSWRVIMHGSPGTVSVDWDETGVTAPVHPNYYVLLVYPNGDYSPEKTKVYPLFATTEHGRTHFQAGHVPLADGDVLTICLLYTSPSPRDKRQSRMPSSA